MKKALHLLTAAVLPVVAISTPAVASAYSGSRLHNDEAFKYTPKAKYELANGGKLLSVSNQKAKKQKGQSKVVTDINSSLPSALSTGYLDGPDGTTWFYTGQLEYTEVPLEGGWATEKYITGFSYTIYDSNHKEVGKIADTVELKDGETRIGQIQLGACITQKFFNTDSNYEVMVLIVANTGEYVNHYRTNVYSIGKEASEPIQIIDGYYVDAVNCGTYSEKFYITFYQEADFPASDVYGTTAENQEDELVYSLRYDIYGPASYSNASATSLKTLYTPYENFEGNDGYPFIGVAEDGKAYFAIVRYEKPYFANSSIVIDPSDGSMTRDTTPNKDNNFVIDLYSSSYSGINLVSSTSIPMELKDETGSTCSFYEIGLLNYNDDVSFGTWTNDGKPSFVVSIEDYATSSDESTYDFKVFNQKGELLADIASDVEGLVDVSDLAGFEHQQGFYKTESSQEVFIFLDMPSLNRKATLNVNLDDNNSLTATMDRASFGDTYKYAISLAYGVTDNDDNTSHYIAWYNEDGTFDHNDIIPLGKMVAMAQPYVKKSVLTPYLFNTDNNREYMFLLKNYVSTTGTKTEESLVILNVDGDVIAKLGATDELGYIYNVTLVNESNPYLWIIYYNDDNEMQTSTFLNLPLSKFEAGGDGSAENPYLISSIGDLQQIKDNLSANYKLACDIDASGYEFAPISGDFTGTLDGNNKTISNLTLNNSEYYNGIFQSITGSGVVKDLTLRDVVVSVNEDNDFVGVVGALVSGNGSSSAKITNVHIDGIDVNMANDDANASFGSIVGRLTLGASVTLSSVRNANINLAYTGEYGTGFVGGIAAQTMTGAEINGCLFEGSLVGAVQTGGILGKASSGDEVIKNCHVSGDITGSNTVGGIVGYSARTAVSNCYVEGFISATRNDKWGAGAKVGGIVGEIAEDWGNGSIAVIHHNVVNLDAISIPALPNDPEWASQATTAHRIVGYSVYNAEPEPVGYDSQYNPIYGAMNDPDNGIQNNYAVDGCLPVDSSIEEGANTTEGASIAESELTQEFFEGLGFAFGEDIENPWAIKGNGVVLYYEDALEGVANVTLEESKLSKVGNQFIAEGCELQVYSLTGVKVAHGANSISTIALNSGVYVVTASKNGAVVATAKFAIR